MLEILPTAVVIIDELINKQNQILHDHELIFYSVSVCRGIQTMVAGGVTLTYLEGPEIV